MDGQINFLEDVPLTEEEERIERFIETTLSKGTNTAGGKDRIRAMYEEDMPRSERAKEISREYGVSGWSVNGHLQQNGPKGIEASDYKNEGVGIKLNWAEVEREIGRMIAEGKY